MSTQLYAPQALFWEQLLVKTQSWSGHFGENKILLPLPAFDPRTVQPVALSQYTLRYCGPLHYLITFITVECEGNR